MFEAAEAATFADVNDIIRKENCKIRIEMPNHKCKSNFECVKTCPNNTLVSKYQDDIRYLCESAHLMNAMLTYVMVNNTLYKNIFAFCVMFNGSSVLETRL